MLSCRLHTRIGEQDLLLPVMGHIVFTTVAGQGWLAGPKPSLDAVRYVATTGGQVKLTRANFLRFCAARWQAEAPLADKAFDADERVVSRRRGSSPRVKTARGAL